MHVIRDVVLAVLVVFKALLLEVVALAAAVLVVVSVVAVGLLNNATCSVALCDTTPSCLEGDNRL